MTISSLENVKDMSPNQKLIEQLEADLEKAKSGEIRAVISVYLYDDNTTSRGWVTDPRNLRVPLLGELSLAFSDFNQNMLIDDEYSAISQAFRSIK